MDANGNPINNEPSQAAAIISEDVNGEAASMLGSGGGDDFAPTDDTGWQNGRSKPRPSRPNEIGNFQWAVVPHEQVYPYPFEQIPDPCG
ncbi:hypothetical protein GCM10023156_42880 [Novipirellula rosea]|uniref:Uncharacterized protein n=1 Tax=Novipirellula rosea TaxID=1031540 RepID=A0ABP8N6X7_9BACT